jgi:hypothetical protein
MAVPKPWTQKVAGLVVHLDQSSRNLHIVVSLAGWKYAGPLREARYLQNRAAGSYHAYKKLQLQAIGFKSVGYTSASAAELKFSWTKVASGVKFTELVILVTLSTTSGEQPYSLTVWAPAASFPAAHGIFSTALKTFRPLPLS